MSANFEWRTDEDTKWELREEKRPSRPPRRPLFVGLLLAALLVVGGYTLYRQLAQRLETATDDVEAAIFASHNLIQQAAAAGDVELFRTQLSGADPAWTSAQATLVAEDLFFERAAFGLTPLQAGTAVSPPAAALSLSPDFQAAELTTVQPYALTGSDGLTTTIQLQQTAVYRLGDNRWLFAPPEREFWGNWLTSEGKYLTVVYPQRDEEVALSLAFDLESLLGRVCRQPGLSCTDEFHMRLRLDTGPSSLQTAANWAHLYSSTPRLELPTPTLLGLPVDDMGYQALYRGYGALLVSGALAELTGYECCRQGMLFQALVDYQLDELGLRPYPLTASAVDTLLRQNFEPRRYASVWGLRLQDTDAWQAPYGLVAFLRSRPQALAASEMLVLLTESTTSDDWFWRVTAVTFETRESFAAEWLAFMVVQSTALASPPKPLPETPLQLVCVPDVEGQFTYYQYNFVQAAWSTIEPPTAGADEFIIPLGRAVFRVAGGIPQVDELVLQSPQGDVDLLALVETGSALWLLNATGPDERYVLLGNYGELDSNGRIAEIYLLDTATCIPGACALTPLPVGETPVWSPDGSRTLLAGPIPLGTVSADSVLRGWRRSLSLASSRGLDAVPFAVGRSPFWLNDDYLGYVALVGGDPLQPETAVLLATLDNPESANTLVTAVDLRNQLPADKRPAILLISDVVAQPDGRALLVSAAASTTSWASYQFLVTVAVEADGAVNTTSVTWLDQFLEGAGGIFSPDGRWIYSDYLGAFILYDTQTNTWKTQESSSARGTLSAWSPDGEWLVFYRPDYLLLQDPLTEYAAIIPHEFNTCYQLDW